jgi:enamine deaminase RidA (YjgF/YER057c/UK114 family)
MNEACARFFPKDAPARSAVGVDFPNAAKRVGIELVAYIPS